MNEQLKQVLLKLGFTPEQIETFSTDDEEKLKAIDTETEYNNVYDNIKEALSNNPSFIDPIESRIRGGVLSSKERKFMKLFGVTKEEYEALPQSTKFDSLVELGYKKLNDGKVTGSDEKLKELNDEIKKLKESNQDYQENIIPKLKNGLELEKQAWKTDLALRKHIQKHKLTVDVDFAFDGIKNKLNSQFDLKLEADGSLKVLEKGKETKAFVDNSEVKIESLVESTLKSAKIIKESNAVPDPSRRTSTGPKPDEKFETPGMRKAREHQEKLSGKSE